MDFVVKAIQSLFLLIDKFVYWAAQLIYKLLIDISNGTVFSQEQIETFGEKIYVLLGIFMLFKVSFSLINYIVNPDDFTDSNKGVGNLVQKILTTLVLIVFTPRIFQTAMVVQNYIVGENILGNIILGTTYDDDTVYNKGDEIVVSVFNSFFYYKTDKETCPYNTKHVDYDSTICVYSTYEDAFPGIGVDTGALNGVWDKKDYKYTALISTGAGIVLILLLIQFCFDIAIRSVKLGFLQIIAPIPIISRIDPKSDKNSKFDKWVSTCVKTYLDLFIRLAALYFGVYAIDLVLQGDIFNGGSDRFLVKAMLILGILMFAKELPKLLEELFGFKLDGNFSLNPMKKLNSVPGAAMIGGAVGGGLAGMAANTYAGIKGNKGIRKTIGSAAAGAIGGTFRGGASGLGKNKNNIGAAMQQGLKGTVAARQTRAERREMEESGVSGAMHRLGSTINRAAGINGSDEETLKREKKLKLAQEFYKKYGEYKLDDNGQLIKGADGKYEKNASDKYAHFAEYDNDMAVRWEKMDKYKNMSYAYDNSRKAAELAFRTDGSYDLKLGTDKDGKDIIRHYERLEEYEADYNKFINTYNKEKKAFEEEMVKVEHEKFKKEYDLYNMGADSYEGMKTLEELTANRGGRTEPAPMGSPSDERRYDPTARPEDVSPYEDWDTE